MRLPDSFLDEIRTRLSLSQVVGRKVTWDLRKSNQGKGDWWAPCPFHQEKTASFHVDDRKGFYYCFGCQAKGNLFGFVMETENLQFMEAVELLAGEAGMTMPARDPRAAEVADRKTKLIEVTEEAARWFRNQLSTNAAREARATLQRRGLSPETVERFELGFAPNHPTALSDHLVNAGHSADAISEVGLDAEYEGGRRDKFRNRIMFPIRDARGRCIAFGGRAMTEYGPKYLNSPDTPLFDKGANLYNLAPARTAAGKGGRLVIAEGYMDVIALSQAGFEAAVAPLGTAVTETQLRLAWRVTPEPVVALDGDAAGLRAALRTADLALPIMEAGQSLRFAILPEGLDPDDLIRAQGRGAMEAVLDGARSMLAVLWDRAIEGKVIDSPERRAMLDRELREMVGRIGDPQLRRLYGAEVKRLRADLYGPGYEDAAPPPRRDERDFGGPRDDRREWQPRRDWQPGRPKAPAGPSAAARAAAQAGTPAPDILLEQVALAAYLLHPTLLEEFADALETVDWRGAGHMDLAAALLDVDPVEDRAEVRAALERRVFSATLEGVLTPAHVRLSPVTRGDAEAARPCLRDALERLAARRGEEAELREAIEDFSDGADESLTYRLAQAARRRAQAERGARDETGATAEAEAEAARRLSDLAATVLRSKT
ncbi:DNA primase [Jannaschia sp. Os4]|uniref:DNA primase n=1 Tax=Jannaschia sp. Os4 TaxID=2807617 RepID=UPI001939AAF5|nr:DNA primase [Jannaschia sp. Os4]MBM2577823.1 DNA primase [Jannaschia sp. Os4]